MTRRLQQPVLPIDSVLPEIIARLRQESTLVLSAAPGAGKTTRVPPALLDAGIAGDRQIVVLEPRRIAARAAAEYIARQRGEDLGADVGYRVRLEHKGGAHTRLWLVTEGIFSRQLARDPFLEAVGAVVLDEFHERHLQGDVALAVVRELQATVRSDLKLVVMSATLETERLAGHLDGCAVVRSEGRAFPVRITHAAERDERQLPLRMRTALSGLLREGDDGGDILAFLPGAAEIRRTAAAIEETAKVYGVDIDVLHGDLPLDSQRRVLEGGGRRRIVLATNVAETALTVEGVTAVIDSGLARAARFDARRGINHLEVRPISRASADQRAGRAGRQAPGRCVRLWTLAEQAGRLAHDTPEISRLDLSGVVLELRAWGLQDLRHLPWLDAPPEAALRRAEVLLVQLGAMEGEGGALTEVGRRLLALSVPPRLGRILLEAERRGCVHGAALLAALASERDILASASSLMQGRVAAPSGAGASDVLFRADLFEEARRSGFDRGLCQRIGLDARRLRAVEQARRQLQSTLHVGGGGSGEASEDDLLKCVLSGFGDRVCRRRVAGSSRAVMVGRTGVMLDESSVVREAEYFVAVELDRGGGRGSEARVRLASAIRREWLDELFPGAVRRSEEIIFDADRERVVGRQLVCFADLVLEERTSTDVDRAGAGELLAEVVGRDPVAALRPDEAAQQLMRRLGFLRRSMPELELEAPHKTLGEAAVLLCAGQVSLAEVRRLDLAAAIGRALTQRQRQALRTEAPVEYRLPSDRLVRIDYEGEAPAVEARIQELFGLTSTPRLAGGRVPLVVRIVGPNYRPVQITDDLESFWRATYPEIRKQLRGRYPKHNWPEDPFKAQPTSKVGRRQPR
jgi:ATP-dependent helicase HrpB